MTPARNDGVQVRRLTLVRASASQNWRGDSRTGSPMTTMAPPCASGSIACSIDGSNPAELSSATRRPDPAPNSSPRVRILLARLACVTTTPFGVPVEPEV